MDSAYHTTLSTVLNCYIGQIKWDAKVKTFKELKEKAINRLE